MAEAKVSGVETQIRAPQLLFSPIKIGTLELKNRLLWPAVAIQFSPLERHRAYVLARARGGAGLIILAGGIVEHSPLREASLALYDDKFIPVLRRLVEDIHAAGARAGIQALHVGRQTSSRMGMPPVAPSPIPCPVFQEMPRVLTTGEVKEMVEKYAQAMRRARAAGFDMAEFHCAHGYLLSEFISARSNIRSDEYGGDILGRTRIVREILARARELVGPDFPISCRINGSDHIKDGMALEESRQVALTLQEAGASILNVSAGVFGGYPVTIAPSYEPQGCYVHLAQAIKEVVNIPVITVGRITDPRMAEAILQQGKADLVAMGRGLVADPDLPRKAQEGRFQDIRRCLGCNQGCMYGIERGFTVDVTCTVNPEVGREREMEIRPAPKPKKVMVIGGGVAGMEAARVAALRGHKVTLYEESGRLGGQWHLAAAPPRKEDYDYFREYLEAQLKKLGVEVRLGSRATPATVRAEAPQALVVATGARPLIPPVPGVGRPEVTTAWDVLAGNFTPGRRVLVVGGNSVGLETAHFLAARGREVTVVEMAPRLGSDMGDTVRWHLRHKLEEHQVRLEASVKVLAIGEEGVRVATERGEETWAGFDSVVLATGALPRDELALELKGSAPEVYVIGDAAKARNGLEAVREGAEVGRKI